MEGLPKITEYTSSQEFLEHFEIHMDCFLLSRNISKPDKAEEVKYKFLKYALSKSPVFMFSAH